MTVQDIRNKYYDKLCELSKLYRAEIQAFLQEHNLDGRVVRVSDGKEGVIQLDQSLDGGDFPRLNFYSITQAGTVSKNSSGCLLDFRDDWITNYRPATEEDT